MTPQDTINQTSNTSSASPPPGKPINIKVLVIAVIVIFAGLFIAGLIPKLFEKHELTAVEEAYQKGTPKVRIVKSTPASDIETLTLPANVGAIQYATINARVDGYLHSRFVDIGDHVKAGQLLALIDTPTVDQQLNQAKADLLQAKAQYETAQANLKEAIAKKITADAEVEKAKTNLDFASVTYKRWQTLCTKGAVSLESRDEKLRQYNARVADLSASEADVKAAEAQVLANKSSVDVCQANIQAKSANVKRLEAEQGFAKVIAPFDGVITQRNVDPGALITAGSQSSNLELFQMAKIDTLRTYVNIPQRFTRYLQTGMKAEVLVPEFPDETFAGTITNIAGALDPNTRTLQTEVRIQNPNHILLPGMYAQVRISGLRSNPWIQVPGTAIVIKTDGQYVVIVKDGKAYFKKITIGRDFGNQVEISVGLHGDEDVIVSPPDDLVDGEAVSASPVDSQQ